MALAKDKDTGKVSSTVHVGSSGTLHGGSGTSFGGSGGSSGLLNSGLVSSNGGLMQGPFGNNGGVLTQPSTTPSTTPTTSSGGSSGGSYYPSVSLPSFQMPTVDRAYYENLANQAYLAQVAQLDSARQSQESQAYNAQKTASSDYFDQYRQAQYNRAGAGLGTSTLGQQDENQVQLAMSSTIGDIWNSLNSNLASLDAMQSEAEANKQLNAESMYQQQQALAFEQAMAIFNAELQKASLENTFQQQAYSSSLANRNTGGTATNGIDDETANKIAQYEYQAGLAETALSNPNISEDERTRLQTYLNGIYTDLNNMMGGSFNFNPTAYAQPTQVVQPSAWDSLMNAGKDLLSYGSGSYLWR